MNGDEMHAFASSLWPINRSLTGDGVRQTLRSIKNHLPTLEIKEVASGTPAFDWTVPKEWRVRDAYIITPNSRKICDFKKNNLHLLGYSTPIRCKLSLAELQKNLFSLPKQPEAIPYITSYYKERWGFCLSENQRKSLVDGIYEVVIDSELFVGSMSYAELYIRGDSQNEVFLSTYVCHPSMANNELSGPVVVTALAKWLGALVSRRYSYRIVFIPETIGSIYYLSQNLEHLREFVIAGFNVSCVGDDRDYSYLPSRRGDTLSDVAAKHVLKWIHPSFSSYEWNDRGSDERQYCAPHIDLPIASIMRTKYAEYAEYHTSLDDLDNVVTPQGLEGGYNALKKAIEAIERNIYPCVTVRCEPQLGKRGLYPTLSTKQSGTEVRLMMNLLTWADGALSLLEIAEKCKVPVWELYPLVDRLAAYNLLQFFDSKQSPRSI